MQQFFQSAEIQHHKAVRTRRHTHLPYASNGQVAAIGRRSVQNTMQTTENNPEIMATFDISRRRQPVPCTAVAVWYAQHAAAQQPPRVMQLTRTSWHALPTYSPKCPATVVPQVITRLPPQSQQHAAQRWMERYEGHESSSDSTPCGIHPLPSPPWIKQQTH